MSIQLTSQFRENAGLPIEEKMVTADLTARDAILSIERYEGLLTYVTSEDTFYYLSGGITNADWVALSGSGGDGGGMIYIDQNPDNGTYGLLAGDVDGVNTEFTVSKSSYLTGKLAVYLNGIAQLQGPTDEWEETDPTLGTFNFITPPSTGDIITVLYVKSLTTTANFEAGTNVTITGDGSDVDPYIINAAGYGGGASYIDQTPDNGTYGLLAGSVNGSNTTFTTSKGSYISGYLQVYKNGLIQLQGPTDDWEETTPGSGIFDFIVAPLTGDIITVVYTTVLSTSGNFVEGTGIDITGTGSLVDPYVIAATGGTPGGSANNVQLNNGSGGFTGSNDLTYDSLGGLISVPGFIASNGLGSYAQAGQIYDDGLGNTFLSLGGNGTVKAYLNLSTGGGLYLGDDQIIDFNLASLTADRIVDWQDKDGTIAYLDDITSGTVTDVSVVSANGFAGSVATATTTPAITISTSVTGLLKGNGTAISAASAGTDYQAPITLTTTGTSGVATFVANTLNIPDYGSGFINYWSRTSGILSPTTTTDSIAIAETGTALTTGQIGANITNSGMTYNTTAGAITDVRGFFNSTSTRSAGANNLVNIGGYFAASGAQTNWSVMLANNAILGTKTSVATPTPIYFSFGGTFGNNAPGSVGNLKWMLYDDGSSLYGIGMSPSLMEFQAAGGGSQAWFAGGTRLATLLSTGLYGLGIAVPTSKFHLVTNALAATVTDASGIKLENQTAAISGTQQYSPSIVLSGKAFGTTAGTSQDVSWRDIVVPIQNTTPTSELHVQSSVNGSAYSDRLVIGSSGAAQFFSTVTGSTFIGNYQSSSTQANSNFVVANATGGIATAAATLQVGGASSTTLRNWSAGTTSSTPAINGSYASFLIGNQSFTEAASGTHYIAANLAIRELTMVTAGGATTTNSASLYIQGAATGATNNYALFVDDGISRFDGDIQLAIAGNGIYVKEGTNATSGVATLVAGTVTVSTTKVTANSRIYLTGQGGSIANLGSYSVTARTAGTSFTITSSNVLDTNTVAWIIIEPAP